MRNVTLNKILCFWIKFIDYKVYEQIVHLAWLLFIFTCAMNVYKFALMYLFRYYMYETTNIHRN